MATINKIDLNGDTYDIESSGLVTTQPTNPSEGSTYYDNVNDVVMVYDGTNWNPISGGGGSGDVVGPNSSTNGHVAVFDGTTGKAIKDGGAVPRIINVTVTTSATTPNKVGTTTEGNYTPTAGDLLLVNFVNGCGVASPTLNIDGTGAKYIRTGNQIASTTTFALGTIANSNIKALLYYDGEFYRCWSTSNAAYSTLPVSEGKTGTSTNSRTISAANLKEIIKYHAVSDTAYGSTWDGVTDIAPSKNAVYDKIESLDMPNVKEFTISGMGDISTGQEIYDYYMDGNGVLVRWGNVLFKVARLTTAGNTFNMELSSGLYGYNDSTSYSHSSYYYLTISGSNGVVDSVMPDSGDITYLSVFSDYATPYTPQYNGSPATKKYVDDSVSVVSGDSGTTYTIKVSNSAPASGTPNTTITFVTGS